MSDFQSVFKMELKDDDLDLVLQSKIGDKSAFEEIIKKYKRIVVNIAYNFVHNSSDAEEIAQEVFIKIYHKLHQLFFDHFLNQQYCSSHNSFIVADKHI